MIGRPNQGAFSSNPLLIHESHQNCCDAKISEDNVQQMLLLSSETNFIRSRQCYSFDLNQEVFRQTVTPIIFSFLAERHKSVGRGSAWSHTLRQRRHNRDLSLNMTKSKSSIVTTSTTYIVSRHS